MKRELPNILMIMADQMAAPALPFYGHSVVKAPNLSAMAENGVVFDNAYCNSPLCAPSRFSMMSGQLPSRIGAYDNAACFPADVPTIAHYLRASGYRTCLSGKMHFVGPDQLHGFEERLTTDIYPSDFGWTPDWRDFKSRPSWYHNMLSVVQAGVCETSNQLDYDEEVAFTSLRKLFELARDDDPRPFFFLISFTHPHDPFAITREYWERYESRDIDPPAVPAIPFELLDAHSKRLHHVCAMDQYAITEERIRNARHAYYGMVSYVDDKVGQLLEGLRRASLEENTIIIFLSDHGEMLGERGFWYKMSFFEWSARVPLLFYAPGRYRPNRITGVVSLLDIMPTLVDLSERDDRGFGDPLDGHSLVPELEGRQRQGETAVLGEMLGEGVVAPQLMIRRGRFKYIASQPDPDQLFDLAADPDELENLAGRPEWEELRHSMATELGERWDAAQIHRQVLESQQRRHLLNRALRQGRYNAWDFQPFEDASTKYMRNHLDLNVLERTARYPSPEVPDPDGPAASPRK